MSIVTRHRRVGSNFALLSRRAQPEHSPLAGWAPDWRWIELSTPAEVVCTRISTSFDDAAATIAAAVPLHEQLVLLGPR